MEANDLSPLAPMSVKDLIWVSIGQSLKIKRDADWQAARYKADAENFEALYLAVLDIRSIQHDANLYVRVSALKDTKRKKIEPLPVAAFPSAIVEKERKAKLRRTKMTREEIQAEDLKNFLDGKTIRPD